MNKSCNFNIKIQLSYNYRQFKYHKQEIGLLCNIQQVMDKV